MTCIDLQVTDIADAVILSTLFSTLFTRGTVIVLTSNRPISSLYENGINYGMFVNTIEMIKHHCIELDISEDRDYRLMKSSNSNRTYFFVGRSEECQDFLRACRADLQPLTLPLNFGRSLHLSRGDLDSRGGVLDVDFEEICDIEMGSSEYRAIANSFKTVVLRGVPNLTMKKHDQARRFITLVDELYEGGVKLVCSAVSPPSELFLEDEEMEGGDESIGEDDVDVTHTSISGDTEWLDERQSGGKMLGELASIVELR